MTTSFPRTSIGGISVSRMIIGSNWLLGCSHRTPAADAMISRCHKSAKDMLPVIEAFLRNGVDTLLFVSSVSEELCKAAKMAEQKVGREMILIDTPILNMDDNASARAESERIIKSGRDIGAKVSLIHHSSAEMLVDKNERVLKRIDDYTNMIRDAGMLPGLSAHMPELIVYSDQNGYDVETYIQIYNCIGFLMQVEVETVASIIHNANKPVITIKPFAAGRITPYIGLNFSFATLRDCDMVAVGCIAPDEVEEDIEIATAFFERRFPNIGKRSSPNKNQAAFGESNE